MHWILRKALFHRYLHFSRFYTRSPILGVLGHVDHGKTTLIDKLRNTNNVSLEAGGITQRNSIFQHTIPENNFKFTIVDTPGHAAFSGMRATGTALTDVAILVVDAAEGIKQQTKECIKLLQHNNVPLVVALNKMDLPTANIDMCFEMLFDLGVETEQVGGNVPAVPISALHGTNITELMSSVKRVTDTLNLSAVLDGCMEGIIFDIKPDNRKQLLTILLVRSGKVKKGDKIITDTHASNVRELLSIDGKRLSVGMPGTPVVVVGPQRFSDNLSVGSSIYAVPRQNTIRQQQRNKNIIPMLQKRIIENVRKDKIYERLPFGKKKVSFMLCADSNSTLETLQQMLEIESDEIVVSVFSSSVRFLSKEQVRLAESIDAHIVLMNVAPLEFETSAYVHHFDIIYDLASSINTALNDVLPPYIDRCFVGEGVIAEIHGTKKKPVAGINSLKGIFSHNMNYSITRIGLEMWTGRIDTLKIFKSPVLETTKDMKECGIGFSKGSVSELVIGDVIKCYYNRTVERKFLSDKFFGRDEEVDNGDLTMQRYSQNTIN